MSIKWLLAESSRTNGVVPHSSSTHEEICSTSTEKRKIPKKRTGKSTICPQCAAEYAQRCALVGAKRESYDKTKPPFKSSKPTKSISLSKCSMFPTNAMFIFTRPKVMVLRLDNSNLKARRGRVATVWTVTAARTLEPSRFEVSASDQSHQLGVRVDAGLLNSPASQGVESASPSRCKCGRLWKYCRSAPRQNHVCLLNRPTRMVRSCPGRRI